MGIAIRLIAVAATLLFVQSAWAQAPSATTDRAKEADAARRAPRQLDLAIVRTPIIIDFNSILERRLVRVAAPYSRTLYFNDKGNERGISAELVREFERFLNQKYKKKLGKRPLTVVIIPTTRDKLLPDVKNGLADIALGNLTVIEERLKLVDMVGPKDGLRTKEILVTGPASPSMGSVDDLAGKTVHVRPSSSFYESLVALNDRFLREGKEKVNLVPVPDALEDEDMMQMLGTGLFQAIVVDDWMAKTWAQVVPKITLHPDIVLREGIIGWAIRKESPQLMAELIDFYVKRVKAQGLSSVLLQRYLKRVKQLKDPTVDADWKRFEAAVALFEKYGAEYSFDPLMLAAQGFQESRLDQNVKSPVGAIGVMQVMPATGAELKVGDIRQTEPNIHAGTKYMDKLMTKYFADAHFTENNRTLFAFASYNAGPGAISSARKRAKQRGLDPDRWFNNVEITVSERIGMETTTYVRNIYKYYVAYRLAVEGHREAAAARGTIAPTATSP